MTCHCPPKGLQGKDSDISHQVCREDVGGRIERELADAEPRGDKVTMSHDPVADARPRLRLTKVTGKSRKRDRRPTDGEPKLLRHHFAAAA